MREEGEGGGAENGRFFEKEDDWGREGEERSRLGNKRGIRSCCIYRHTFRMTFPLLSFIFLLLLFILFYVINCYSIRWKKYSFSFLPVVVSIAHFLPSYPVN